MLKYLPTIVFCRHGSCVANELSVLVGSSDSPLSKAGEHQAVSLAKWAKSRAVEAIYSSPAGRAVTTAEIIGLRLQLPVMIRPELRERDYGPYEGIGRERLLAVRNSKGLDNRDPTQDWENVAEVESDGTVWNRVKPLVAEVSISSKTSLLVTHAGVIKAVLHEAFQIPSRRVLCFKILPGTIVGFRKIAEELELMEFCPDPCCEMQDSPLI